MKLKRVVLDIIVPDRSPAPSTRQVDDCINACKKRLDGDQVWPIRLFSTEVWEYGKEPEVRIPVVKDPQQ